MIVTPHQSFEKVRPWDYWNSSPVLTAHFTGPDLLQATYGMEFLAWTCITVSRYHFAIFHRLEKYREYVTLYARDSGAEETNLIAGIGLLLSSQGIGTFGDDCIDLRPDSHMSKLPHLSKTAHGLLLEAMSHECGADSFNMANLQPNI